MSSTTGTRSSTSTCRCPGAATARSACPTPGRDGQRLFVTTDRLSAFDRVLAGVPYKGQVLNQLAAWWFDRTADIVANHVVAVPDPNVLIARSATPLPVEVVVRGYITGVTSTSLWKPLRGRRAHDLRLPLPRRAAQEHRAARADRDADDQAAGRLDVHDEPLTWAEVVERGLVDAARWEQVTPSRSSCSAAASRWPPRPG